MTSTKAVLDKVRGILSNQSGSLRRAMLCDDPVKSESVVGFLDPLESLRSLLNTAEIEDACERPEFQSSLKQWGLAACDLGEALREQLDDFDVGTFTELANTFEDHSNALLKLISLADCPEETDAMQRTLESLCDAGRFLPSGTDGFAFWTKHFGNIYSVDVAIFRSKLTLTYHGLIEERTWIQLQASLDKSNTGNVTAMKWGAFLQGFGCDVTEALHQMRETLGERYFAGFVSYAESVALLSTCAPGAFLIRFSTSQPCSLVLARKAISGGAPKVLQTLIISRRGCFEMDGRRFSSLREVIESFAEECLFPAPTVKTIARAKYFKGFLSKEQTKDLLKNERDGTFLFRFSESEPGTLVVGFKENNTVRQTRIHSEPDKGGYCLAGTTQVYSTIEDIVQRNSGRLKYGYMDREERTRESAVAQAQSRSRFAGMNDRYGGISPEVIVGSSIAEQYGFVDSLM